MRKDYETMVWRSGYLGVDGWGKLCRGGRGADGDGNLPQDL